MIDFLNKYGFWAIMLLILLEYACFPLPSEVLLPLSGGIANKAGINFIFLVISSTIMAVIGSLICYIFGRIFGNKILTFLENKYPKSKKGIAFSKDKYLKYALFSTSIGRLIPICRTYISIIAGIYKQNIIVYVISTSLGAFVWNMLLLSIGYYTTANIDTVKYYYGKYKFGIIGLILVLLVLSIVLKEYKSKKKAKDENL